MPLRNTRWARTNLPPSSGSGPRIEDKRYQPTHELQTFEGIPSLRSANSSTCFRTSANKLSGAAEKVQSDRLPGSQIRRREVISSATCNRPPPARGLESYATTTPAPTTAAATAITKFLRMTGSSADGLKYSRQGRYSSIKPWLDLIRLANHSRRRNKWNLNDTPRGRKTSPRPGGRGPSSARPTR